MNKFSKGKPLHIRKAHYLTSLTVFIVAFGALGVILEFSGFAANPIGTVVGIDGKCLDNANNTAQNNNKIQLFTCNGSVGEEWTVNGTANNAGTIVNENGFCIGISGGNTANSTDAILFGCLGDTSQNWTYDAANGRITDAKSGTCLDSDNSGTANGNQIVIETCNGSAGEEWDYKLPATSPTPTPTPTPTHTPTPTSTPSPTKPKPTSSPSPTPSIAVTNTFSPPTSASTVNDTPTSSTPSATESLTQTPGSDYYQTPVISDLSVSDVTSSTVRLTWKSNVASLYTIKYGVSPKELTKTVTLNATGTTINVVLRGLPSGKHIYATITPLNGTAQGAIKNVSFKTDAHNILTPIVLSLLLVLIIIGVLIKFIGRKPVVPDHTNEELPLPEAPPVIPQEDQATYNNRVNWWMPESMRQTGLKGGKRDDEYPDMFEEGRQRLDEEEKEHKLPKE